MAIKNIIKHVSDNFRNPNGIGGIVSTKIMNIMNQRQYKAVLDNINMENGNTILDIGFGNGYLIQKLFKKNNSIKICGIEISPDMIKKASKKFSVLINNGKLKISLENINKTSFENETFDKICTVNTIYFWDNPEKCFAEIKRIIKSNGIFLNLIYTKEYLEKTIFSKYGFRKYTLDDIIKITEKNGMQIIEIIEIRKGMAYCVVCKIVN